MNRRLFSKALLLVGITPVIGKGEVTKLEENRFHIRFNPNSKQTTILKPPTETKPWKQVIWYLSNQGTANVKLEFSKEFSYSKSRIICPGRTDYVTAIYNPIISKWDIVGYTCPYEQ